MKMIFAFMNTCKKIKHSTKPISNHEHYQNGHNLYELHVIMLSYDSLFSRFLSNPDVRRFVLVVQLVESSHKFLKLL